MDGVCVRNIGTIGISHDGERKDQGINESGELKIPNTIPIMKQNGQLGVV